MTIEFVFMDSFRVHFFGFDGFVLVTSDGLRKAVLGLFEYSNNRRFSRHSRSNDHYTPPDYELLIKLHSLDDHALVKLLAIFFEVVFKCNL